MQGRWLGELEKGEDARDVWLVILWVRRAGMNDESVKGQRRMAYHDESVDEHKTRLAWGTRTIRKTVHPQC